MHTYSLYIGFHSSCCQWHICRQVLGLPEHLPGHEIKHGWQLIQECVDTFQLGCFTMLKVLDLRHQWLPSPTPWEEPRCRLKLCEETMQGIGQLRYLEELVSYLSVPKLICMALKGFQCDGVQIFDFFLPDCTLHSQLWVFGSHSPSGIHTV